MPEALITPYFFFLSLGDNSKIDSQPFFLQSQLSFLLLAEAKFPTWSLFKLTPYGKFGFSRPDLDGNKLAKGVYLARKASDREVFI